MGSFTDTILIPYDFTEKADYAVRHAAVMGKNMKAELVLLNIVKKQSQDQEVLEQLNPVCDKFTEELGIKTIPLVREGTIFKTINEVVDELKSIVVVMGTHGMKGIQKLTGSWALKVIVGCHVPYLIVQDEPKYSNPANILFPVDYKLETKEKLKWVSMLGYLCNIRVCLFGQEGNGPMYDNPAKANMSFCKRYLEERDIPYDVVWVDQRGSFYELSLKYANENNVDIIMITTTRDIAFHDYILGAYEQTIIANDAGIPVFVVNPRTEVKLAYTNF
ncbi:MAG: universal stress protein [Marinilabiliaceae bacterium]|nr:universal stress protein [Marinilabiliaceae bacterium]